MTAKIGTVTLPYGLHEENLSPNEKVAVTDCPFGSPIFELLGRGAEAFRAKATVTKAIFEDLRDQHLGSPMVSVDTGRAGESPYGVIIENVDGPRVGKFPNLVTVTASGYRLDYDVTNVSYDFLGEDTILSTGSQIITDPTDEVIDGYITRLVMSSSETCQFTVQTSATGISGWTDYPDDLGFTVTRRKQVVDLSHLTGFLRVLMDNTGSTSTTVRAKLYLMR